MVTYFCIHCWHASPNPTDRCPKCGSTDKFCTEQKYGELMVRYLDHPMRRYRLVALKNLKWMKWKDAIPDIRERIRIEKEPDVRAEARRTLEAIETYHNRTDKPVSLTTSSEHTHMYDHIYEPACRVISVRKVLRKHGHQGLRFHKKK